MNEKKAFVVNGFIGVAFIILLFGLGVYALINGKEVLGAIEIALGLIIFSGIFVVQPNQAGAVVFFGQYLGSVRRSGLWLGIPFTIRRKVSLRVRNFNSAKLKVNDIEGTPIEIAAVVVFPVVDSAKAMFEVDNYEQFVEIQSETALRHIASQYPYDNFEQEGHSLRGNTEEIAAELKSDLQPVINSGSLDMNEAVNTPFAIWY